MCTVFRFVTFDLTDAAGDADDENQFFDQDWQATPTCEGQYLYENTTVVNQLDQNGNLVEVEEEGWRNSLADYINKDTLIFNDLDRTCIALLPVLDSYATADSELTVPGHPYFGEGACPQVLRGDLSYSIQFEDEKPPIAYRYGTAGCDTACNSSSAAFDNNDCLLDINRDKKCRCGAAAMKGTIQ
jgi:hypothetical protein